MCNGFAFILMVKGMKNFIHDQIRQHKGSFESSWGNQIAEDDSHVPVCIGYQKALHTHVLQCGEGGQ